MPPLVAKALCLLISAAAFLPGRLWAQEPPVPAAEAHGVQASGAEAPTAEAPAAEAPTQAPAAAEASGSPSEQSWFLVLLGGKRAGTQTETVWGRAGEVRRTDLSLRLMVNRFGQAFTIVQRQHWIEGQTLQSVESETDMNGQLESLSARVQGGELRLSRRRPGAAGESVVPENGPLLGPRGAEDLLRAGIASGAGSADSARELSYREFSPETGAAQEVRLRLLGSGELADSLGVLHRGQRVDLESSALPGVITAGVYDGEGRLEYSATRAGVLLEQVRSSAAAAEAAASDLELFEMASLSLPVRWAAGLAGPGGPPALGSLRSVTVRFTGPALAELARAVQSQRSELGGPGLRREGKDLVLTLEAPPPAPAWPQDAQAGGEPARSGFYLDLDDPRLEDLLARCAPPGFACLERLVDRTIRAKSLSSGFAGVSEVLDSRSGDCTEHALLLAALLRKRGLQARIAYGFLLTEAGFIGHAWTEAHAGGRWFWLDPSFPGGRPYGFKLRLGVIDPAQPVWGQIGLSLLAVAGGVQAEILEQVDGR